jgi:hypothetical protein
MRFYGNGVVWDPDNDRRLCKFSKPTEPHGKGVFETDDERIIAKLIRLGYEHEKTATPDPAATVGFTPNPIDVDGNPVAPNDTVTTDTNVKEIRRIGKELGLTFPVGMKKVDMVEAINAKLGA